MDTSTITQLSEWIRQLGLITGLVLILYASYKRWWVWGSEYRVVCADRDQWKDLALRLGGLADKVLTLHRTEPL